MHQANPVSHKKITEFIKKHWQIGAVILVVNVLFILLLVFFFYGLDRFIVDGSLSLENFKTMHEVLFALPLVIVFIQFFYFLYPTVKSFLRRNDADADIGYQRQGQ